ncbi:MAG: hypothetical protein KAH07_06685 [Flavobacteriaceae bacterium]|nr:hypothetical protein [Flavobacteriaceae bacterium]
MKFFKLISYVFHPILVPIVGSLLFFILLPRHTDKGVETTILLAVFIGTYIIPLVFLSFLKKSKAIETYELKTVGERKFPILFTIILLYLLSIFIKKYNPALDLAFFYYGMQFSLLFSVGLLYIKFKTSLHMLGIGGLFSFFVLFSYRYQINLLLLLSFFSISAGLIASSRLYLKAHTRKELIWGFFIGAIGQSIYFFSIYNI